MMAAWKRFRWMAFPSMKKEKMPSGSPSNADRKSTRLNSSHSQISYAVFCLKKKKKNKNHVCYHMLNWTHRFNRRKLTTVYLIDMSVARTMYLLGVRMLAVYGPCYYARATTL